MLSHVFVGVNDFPSAFAFYTAVMETLGYPLKFAEPGEQWAGWKPLDAERPLFLIGHPFNREPATNGNGQMIALRAPSRAAVDECYATALSNGGRCEGPPGPRPHYHANYYGAYFRDPDGNKICICNHDPA